MIFATAITLAALGLRPDQSVLVEDSHVHDWSVFATDGEGEAWIDANWRERVALEGEEFPTVLVRFNMIDEADGSVTGDILLAVDCQNKAQGMVAGWGRSLATGEEHQEQVETIVFDFTEPPFDDEDIAIFQFACGDTWQP